MTRMILERVATVRTATETSMLMTSLVGAELQSSSWGVSAQMESCLTEASLLMERGNGVKRHCFVMI